MNGRRLLSIGAAGLLLVAGSRPGAAQTAYGPGGLFIHPTAFVRPSGAATLNISWFEQKLPGSPTASWLPVSLTAGVGGRAEVGAIYVNRLDLSSGGSSGGVFAKVQLMPDSANRPAVALAASYLGGGIQLSSVSAVASHRFGEGTRSITGHFGAQWARRADIPVSRDDTGLFAGVEIPLSRRLSLVGEYGTRFDFDYKERSALGLVWRGARGYQIGVGAVNVGRSRDQRFFVGVGFPLGGN